MGGGAEFQDQSLFRPTVLLVQIPQTFGALNALVIEVQFKVSVYESLKYFIITFLTTVNKT